MNKFMKILSSSIAFLIFAFSVPVNAAQTSDPTRGLTRVERQTVTFDVWISSAAAALVIRKESKGNCLATGARGKYRGKWQVNAGFWRTYGGLEFAPTADQATCDQQDLVAYKGWLARGGQPWGIR